MAVSLPEKYQVTVPGWDDVIHIIPDAARSPEELREIKRRRARRIRTSPTPQAIQSAREILTWVDDTQDALVTLSLGTRVLVKTTGKIIPGARTIATLADALDISKGVAAVSVRFPQDKRAMKDLMRRSPSSYRARLLRTARTGRIAPGLGEALQVLQTTDSLLGIGISLGAVTSAPVDALFLTTTGGDLLFPSAAPAATWEEVEQMRRETGYEPGWGEIDLQPLRKHLIDEQGQLRIPIPKVLPSIPEILEIFPTLTAEQRYGDILDASVGILEAAPLLQQYGQTLSFEDHLATLAAQHLALRHIAGLLALRDWTPDALLKARLEIPRHPEIRRDTANALAAAGGDPRDPGTPPSSGRGAPKTWGDILQHTPGLIDRAGPHWRSQAPDPTSRLFADVLSWEVARQYLYALEGPFTRLEETLNPEALAIELMLDAPIPPEVWQNRPALETLHRLLTDTLRVTAAKRIPPDTIQRAVAQALGAPNPG